MLALHIYYVSASRRVRKSWTKSLSVLFYLCVGRRLGGFPVPRTLGFCVCHLVYKAVLYISITFENVFLSSQFRRKKTISWHASLFLFLHLLHYNIHTHTNHNKKTIWPHYAMEEKIFRYPFPFFSSNNFVRHLNHKSFTNLHTSQKFKNKGGFIILYIILFISHDKMIIMKNISISRFSSCTDVSIVPKIIQYNQIVNQVERELSSHKIFVYIYA